MAVDLNNLKDTLGIWCLRVLFLSTGGSVMNVVGNVLGLPLGSESYGVAEVSRFLQIIGLFCKRAL